MAARTVPATATKAATQLITGALWNAGPYAAGNFLLAVPVFRGHQATSFNMSSGASYAMSLDVTDVDSDGGHSNTVNNSRYTCQVPGWYWIEGYFATGSGGSQARFDSFVAKNGTQVAGASQMLARFSDVQALHAAAAVQLAAGDYVEIWGRQFSGSTLSTFDGIDLCPTMNAFWIHS